MTVGNIEKNKKQKQLTGEHYERIYRFIIYFFDPRIIL